MLASVVMATIQTFLKCGGYVGIDIHLFCFGFTLKHRSFLVCVYPVDSGMWFMTLYLQSTCINRL